VNRGGGDTLRKKWGRRNRSRVLRDCKGRKRGLECPRLRRHLGPIDPNAAPPSFTTFKPFPTVASVAWRRSVMVAAAARWVAVAAAAAWHRFWVARADRAGGGEKTMDRRQRPRMEGVGEEAMDWWQRRTGVGGQRSRRRESGVDRPLRAWG
jgi:hypothetical protein